MSVIWCDKCGLPMDCPDHPDGIPYRVNEDEVGYTGCDCPVLVCVCAYDGVYAEDAP